MSSDDRLTPHYRSPQTNDGQWVHHDVAAAVIGKDVDQLNYLIRTGRGPEFQQHGKRGVRMYHMDALRKWLREQPNT